MSEDIGIQRTYPAEMTPALRRVLGLMNFETCPVAHLFRAAGHDIPPKAEMEQAFVLHWLIGLAIEHGDSWHDAAMKRIRELKAEAASKNGAPA